MKNTEVRFAFGRNWQRFLRLLNQQRIADVIGPERAAERCVHGADGEIIFGLAGFGVVADQADRAG